MGTEGDKNIVGCAGITVGLFFLFVALLLKEIPSTSTAVFVFVALAVGCFLLAAYGLSKRKKRD